MISARSPQVKIFCALIDLEQKQVQPRKIAEKNRREVAESSLHVAQVSHLLEDWRNTWENVRMVSIGAKMVRIRRDHTWNSPRSLPCHAPRNFNSPSAGLRDDGHHPQVGLLAHTCVSRPADERRWRDAGEASIRHDDHLHSLITL